MFVIVSVSTWLFDPTRQQTWALRPRHLFLHVLLRTCGGHGTGNLSLGDRMPKVAHIVSYYCIWLTDRLTLLWRPLLWPCLSDEEEAGHWRSFEILYVRRDWQAPRVLLHRQHFLAPIFSPLSSLIEDISCFSFGILLRKTGSQVHSHIPAGLTDFKSQI